MADPTPAPPGKVTLGIHSNVDPAGPTSLTDGHAWISVNRDGVVSTYGLWPDDHPMIRGMGLSNDGGSDIRRNLEAGQPASASRYYALTPEQAQNLERELKGSVHWGYTNTCASWAGDVSRRVTGERLDTSEVLGITDTPRQLSESIREKEKLQPTAPATPLPTGDVKHRSSSSLADAGAAPDLSQHALAGHLRQQLPASVSDPMVAYATLRAIENGIDRPDQLRGVVVSDDVIHIAGHVPGMRVSIAQQDATLPTHAELSQALQRHSIALAQIGPDQDLQLKGPRLPA